MAGRPIRKTRHWLIQARHDSGKTFEQLSQELGITKQAIYYYESGERTPNPKLAKKIAKVLNFDWTKFYEE